MNGHFLTQTDNEKISFRNRFLDLRLTQNVTLGLCITKDCAQHVYKFFKYSFFYNLKQVISLFRTNLVG